MQNKIADFRKKRGVTQDELAQKVDVSRPYLSDIENGKSSPGGPLMLKIAKAFNAKVEEIFFEDTVRHTEQKCPKKQAS